MRDKYEKAALQAGWFRLKRGWYHPNALQYWGWPEPLRYSTAKQLCEAENIITEDEMSLLRKGREYRRFNKGEKVKVLLDRIGDWMKPGQEFEIAEVCDHGYIEGVGHTQSLRMTDGQPFSGWWFDDACMSHAERAKYKSILQWHQPLPFEWHAGGLDNLYIIRREGGHFVLFKKEGDEPERYIISMPDFEALKARAQQHLKYGRV